MGVSREECSLNSHGSADREGGLMWTAESPGKGGLPTGRPMGWVLMMVRHWSHAGGMWWFWGPSRCLLKSLHLGTWSFWLALSHGYWLMPFPCLSPHSVALMLLNLGHFRIFLYHLQSFLHWKIWTMSKVSSCSCSLISQTFNGGNAGGLILGLGSGKEICQWMRQDA